MVKKPKRSELGARSQEAGPGAFAGRGFVAPKRSAGVAKEPGALFDAYLQRKERQEAVQRASGSENATGMPDHLKTGLESLSGMDLSGVRVHYNSSEPAKVNALAYTQGSSIYVGPGQEKHLAHEGWHSVQQMQGRVRPTMEAHGVAINDDPKLEHEADAMGSKAEREGRS